MKYLVNAEMKVLRKGAFVKADESAGEFIWDDKVATVDDRTADELRKMCSANGFHSSKNSNKHDLFENITNNLPNLDIAEQKTMSQSDIIKDVVTQAGANRKEGMDPDAFEVEVFTECIQRLNADGITFKIKQLGSLVKKEIAEQGLIITTAQRKEQVNAILTEADFKPANWDDVEEMMDKLISEVSDTDRKQALSSIRRFLKANEIEIPKRAKAAKVSLRQQAINYMISNSPVEQADLVAFLVEAGKTEEVATKTAERLQNLQSTIDAAFAAGVASVSGSAKAA